MIWWWGHRVSAFILVQTFEAVKGLFAHLCANSGSLLMHFLVQKWSNLFFHSNPRNPPFLLRALPQLISGKTHSKVNIPALFSTWDKQNVCWHAVNGLARFCRSAHEEQHRGCRPARPIFRRGLGSPAASFIFVKTGSALGSCAHKVIFCCMLLTASAPPSSVFSELYQVLMKQWPHSYRWLWYLEDQRSQSRQNPEHEQNWIIGYFAHCQHFLKTFITWELFR